MGDLKYNGTTPEKLYFGSAEVFRLFYGATKVWEKAKLLAAVAAASAATAMAATMKHGRKLGAAAAASAAAGQAATLRVARLLAAEAAGSVSEAAAATLQRAVPLAAEAATSVSEAFAALLRAARMLAGEAAGSVSEGQAAVLVQASGQGVSADAAASISAGQAAALKRGPTLGAAAGASTSTPQAATLKRGAKVGAAAGASTSTPQAATMRRGRKLGAAAAASTSTPQAATLTVDSPVPEAMYGPILDAREGWGQDSIGGRDGEVYYVTNLNDSGAGSFRAAWESADPLWIRFDGLSGTIDLLTLCQAGAGYKTIDGRDANITFRSNNGGNAVGAIRADSVSNIIITGCYFDGQWTSWSTDDEGEDLISLYAATDVFIYRNFFTHSRDGAIDSHLNEYAQRISIVQNRFFQVDQAMLLVGHEISILRNSGRSIGLRFPTIVNGRGHSANNLIADWLDIEIEKSLKDTGGSPSSYAELLSEQNTYYAGGTTNDVGEITGSGAILQRPTNVSLNSVDFTASGTVNSTFASDSRAKTTVVAPSGATAVMDLVSRIDQEAGPETRTLRNPRLVAQANGSDSSVEVPGGIQAGDLAVVWYRGINNTASTPSHATPSGWTSVATAGSSGGSEGIRAKIIAKVLDGTETTVDLGSATTVHWAIGIFRANVPITGFSVNSANVEGSASNPASQTVTTGSAIARPVLSLGCGGCTAAVASPTATPTNLGALITSPSTGLVGWFGVIGEGLPLFDFTYDIADGGRQALVSAYLLLESAAERDAVEALFSSRAGFLFDISDLTSLYSDRGGAAATTRAVVDGPVGTVKDLSGGGNHAVAASDAARPTLRRSGETYYLEFDGSNDQLDFDGSDLVSSNYTIAAAAGWRDTSPSSDEMIFDGSAGSTNADLHFGRRSSGAFTLAQWANDLNYSISDWSTHVRRFVGIFNSSSGHFIRMNDAQVASNANTTGLSGWTGAAIGRGAAGINFYGGVGFNAALSGSDLDKLEALLRRMAGV